MPRPVPAETHAIRLRAYAPDERERVVLPSASLPIAGLKRNSTDHVAPGPRASASFPCISDPKPSATSAFARPAPARCRISQTARVRVASSHHEVRSAAALAWEENSLGHVWRLRLAMTRPLDDAANQFVYGIVISMYWNEGSHQGATA